MSNLNFPVPVEEPEQTKKEADPQYVTCIPDPENPTVQQTQHRVVCLMRPYAYCAYCEHRNFELVFKEDPEAATREVACPRWKDPTSRLKGDCPDYYLPVKEHKCAEMPYEFCASCPSRDKLKTLKLDKEKPDWYGRWHRLSKEE